MEIFFYIASIVLANVITASIMPLKIGLLIIPAGSLLIGLTFILRDFVQRAYGRLTTYKVIALALCLSAVTSHLLDDTLYIVMASALAFFISEVTDTEIYSRLKVNFAKRVFFSGIGGGFLDSFVFVIVGLSPMGAGFLPWNLVGAAVIGQVIVKTVMQGLGLGVVKILKVEG